MQPLPNVSSHCFLTFRVDTQLYALRAEDVSEVMLLPTLARIPQAPPALLGLASLRGTVLPVVGLRELLSKPSAPVTTHTRVIVLDVGAPVALTVDSVEILEVAAAHHIEAQHHALSSADGEQLLGVFSSGPNQTAVKILDIKSLLEAAFSNRTRPARPVSKAGSNSAHEPAAEAKSGEVLVTFEVAGQEFGLHLDAVQEIIPLPAAMTSVVRAEAVVLGVIAVRDSLLPLLSLRTLLGFGASLTIDGREKVLILQVGGAQVGLVTDCVRSIVAAEPELIDPIPPVLAARTGGESRIKAIYRGEAGRRLISILSPDQLFREEVMQHLVTQHKTQNSAPQANTATHSEQIFLIFQLGDDEFGLPIEAVVEVAQVPTQITRVPKTPKFLEGVVNLRGEVLPVVDQRRRFDMPKLENTEGRKLVVIQTERHRAGLIVDRVAEVLRIASDAIAPPPDLTDATSRLVRGVINLDTSERLVLVLDPSEVLTRAEQGLLDSFQALGKTQEA